MALGSDLLAKWFARPAVTIAAARGLWQTIISAPETQDAASITNPTTEIDDSTTVIFELGDRGTILELCLGYDDELTTITNPVVKVFGRHRDTDGTKERWTLIRNLNGDITSTLTTASTDATDGTLKYTTPHPDTARFDVGSYSQVIVGVQTALAGTGTVNNSVIQARIWG